MKNKFNIPLIKDNVNCIRNSIDYYCSIGFYDNNKIFIFYTRIDINYMPIGIRIIKYKTNNIL